MRARNLNGLRMFDAAARHGNFRLAAEELNLTQGAVAQQVRRLEAELETKLFYRHARGLRLTDPGHEYHTAIREALAIIDDATKRARSERRPIVISTPPSFASKWLVPRLFRFTAQNPGADVRTIASEVLADFKTDGVDIAIRLGKPPFDAALAYEPLADLNLCAVCSPSYRASDREIDALEDFSGYRLIQDGHHHWDDLFEKAGIGKPDKPLQFNQTALAIDAAVHGQGIALTPELLVRDEVAHGTLTVIWRDGRALPEGYFILSPAEGARHGDAEALIAWLLEEARGAV